MRTGARRVLIAMFATAAFAGALGFKSAAEYVHPSLRGETPDQLRRESIQTWIGSEDQTSLFCLLTAWRQEYISNVAICRSPLQSEEGTPADIAVTSSIRPRSVSE